MNESLNLYIFKYTAIDSKGNHINSSFLAFSMDDCKMFLDSLGLTNIEVRTLKKGEKAKDINKKLNIKEVYEDFSYFSQSLKGGNNLFSSIVFMVNHCDISNKDIYLRISYLVYKGYRISQAFHMLNNIIPNDIIDEIEKGDRANNLTASIDKIINLYYSKRKKNIFEKIFSKNSQSISVDASANENLKDIDIHKNVNAMAKVYSFRYKATNDLGKKISGTFEAETLDDCKRFLELQGFTNISVEPRKKYDIDIAINSHLKAIDLSFDLTQLSTYIKAGISLVDGVTILAKQAKGTEKKKVYQKLGYDLLKGYSLSDAMEKQATSFPELLINMIRSAEMTGDLTSILDDMADYYEGIYQTRKTMRSAMTYPILVLVLAIAVFVFMMLYLVPQFISLYESNGATLPGITLFVIGVSNFLQKNLIYLILGIIIFILIFYLCYKNIAIFRKNVQMIVMKIPVFGNIIIYNEVYNFTKTFASLINHGVFITDSMAILSKITNNEIYKGIIAKTMSNLAKGENISKSFQNEWAFPTVAYHMLVTGESTGQLGIMMEKVSDHYRQLHKSLVDQLKSLVEPVMILIVAGIVGVILISIITPMFSIYDQIQ